MLPVAKFLVLAVVPALVLITRPSSKLQVTVRFDLVLVANSPLLGHIPAPFLIIKPSLKVQPTVRFDLGRGQPRHYWGPSV